MAKSAEYRLAAVVGDIRYPELKHILLPLSRAGVGREPFHLGPVSGRSDIVMAKCQGVSHGDSGHKPLDERGARAGLRNLIESSQPRLQLPDAADAHHLAAVVGRGGIVDARYCQSTGAGVFVGEYLVAAFFERRVVEQHLAVAPCRAVGAVFPQTAHGVCGGAVAVVVSHSGAAPQILACSQRRDIRQCERGVRRLRGSVNRRIPHLRGCHRHAFAVCSLDARGARERSRAVAAAHIGGLPDIAPFLPLRSRSSPSTGIGDQAVGVESRQRRRILLRRRSVRDIQRLGVGNNHLAERTVIAAAVVVGGFRGDTSGHPQPVVLGVFKELPGSRGAQTEKHLPGNSVSAERHHCLAGQRKRVYAAEQLHARGVGVDRREHHRRLAGDIAATAQLAYLVAGHRHIAACLAVNLGKIYISVVVAVIVGTGIVDNSGHQTPVAAVGNLAGSPFPGVEHLRYSLVAHLEPALGPVAVLLRKKPAAPGSGRLLHPGALYAAAGGDVLLPGQHTGLDYGKFLEKSPHTHI